MPRQMKALTTHVRHPFCVQSAEEQQSVSLRQLSSAGREVIEGRKISHGISGSHSQQHSLTQHMSLSLSNAATQLNDDRTSRQCPHSTSCDNFMEIRARVP